MDNKLVLILYFPFLFPVFHFTVSISCSISHSFFILCYSYLIGYILPAIHCFALETIFSHGLICYSLFSTKFFLYSVFLLLLSNCIVYFFLCIKIHSSKIHSIHYLRQLNQLIRFSP